MLFATISQHFIPDCLIDLFPFTPSELRFMPYEQVGEQNRRILYKHYMDTGEIKDCLLTKIWVMTLQWFCTYGERCLIKIMQISTVKRYKDTIFLGKSFKGCWLSTWQKRLNKMDFWPRVFQYENMMSSILKGDFDVKPVKISGFSHLAHACSCLLMCAHFLFFLPHRGSHDVK